MGLLVECPKCKTRLSLKGDQCRNCGFGGVKKTSGKVYWIEYYADGSRKRERIGPSKQAAEQRLRDVLKARTEERIITKDLSGRHTLGLLCNWYLALPEVKKKASYRRDEEFIRHLKRLLGESTRIRDLTVGKVESYQQERLAEPSPRHPGENTKPATVNKEVTCLKTILNRAVRHGKPEVNPVERVRKLPENNVRMRLLSQEELDRLLDACADHIRPIVLIAYHTGMRRSEIIYLTWGEVDFKSGFIRLPAERTKTRAERAILMHPHVKRILSGLPRGLHTDRVFLFKGQPVDEFKTAFRAACRRAEIEDFTFHDLRHVALNNLRLAGNDYFKIMALSGHKTMSTFKRYNLVTEEELKTIKWADQGGTNGAMDTYMDTKEKRATSQST